MKFNSRLARPEHIGSGILSEDDIVDVMKQLIAIRNGKDDMDDIDHLGNRRIRSVGEMAETNSVWVWCVLNVQLKNVCH